MHRYIEMLIPGIGDSIAVELETATGHTATITLDFLSPDAHNAMPKAEQPKWEAIDESEYMSYGFLDRGRRAMYFRMANIVSREALLEMQQRNYPDMKDNLARIYPIVLKREMPADIDEAIAAFPSLAATFRAMLVEMKEAGAPYLMIDLRDNDGGMTPIVHTTLYQLYGDRYFETDMGDRSYQLLSPLVLEKYGMTLEQVTSQDGAPEGMGEYTFGWNEPDTRTVGQKRADFVSRIYGGDPAPVADLDGKPVYSPERVFVITDDGTFSAAFHYAFYLWKMGATVVGVPSAQAPNTFMEVTPFKLPYTGLTGSISNSAQVFLPGDDYRRYGFDHHAELLYLMDYLGLNN